MRTRLIVIVAALALAAAAAAEPPRNPSAQPAPKPQRSAEIVLAVGRSLAARAPIATATAVAP